MASAGKPEISSPFFPRRNSLIKTSAEIVSEVRQSLRVQSTQRPFTPRDAHRQLFGTSSVRASADNRPPSAFSLHAQNFDSPDSRPGSGTRLSPLHHKPTFPIPGANGDPVHILPKPPADPLEVRRPLIGPRARLRRAGSLPIMPPAETDGSERLNQRPEQRQSSAKQRLVPDHVAVHSGPLRPVPNTTQNESKISSQGVDLEVKANVGAKCKADVKNNDSRLCTEQDSQSLVWNNRIAPLLEQLEAIVAGGQMGSEVGDDGLCNLCERLYDAMATADILGRRCKGRSKILRTLFRLIDLNSAQLNLHIAKICIQLCVSGNNLLNICKLVFKLSRSESNDDLFQDSPVLDSLLDILSTEDVSSSGEVLLYCVGTLKFLSGNTTILKRLLDKNCVGVFHKLIQRLQPIEETNMTIAGHILVQLTATLRNLADHPESRPLFVSFGLLSDLCLLLQQHHKDQDICTNISRIFSKLSSYSECRLTLSQTPGCYQLFLEVLSQHHQKQDLVVRLLFTLGNITAKSDEARLQLFECDGSVDVLLQIYHRYQRRDNDKGHPQQHTGTKLPGGPHQCDDVLVKLVRVMANMCIHRSVGPALANNATFIQLLIETLELRCVQESEELTVNSAATINNLSFYQQPNSALRNCHLTIAKLMMKLLLSSSMDAVLEATRVFGNLTQSSEVRDYIMQSKAHQFIVTLLDSKSPDVCFSACGVLTNLSSDIPNRDSLALEGIAAKLMDCLQDLGQGDWQLAGQLCQALWNLAGGCPESFLDQEQSKALLDILTAYLDKDEALKWIENEDLKDYHRACWELEFFPVAQKLMKVLQPLTLNS
ncbi:armadillo repeat-containing protein 2 [Boleophthalmus pectinirostris]|uniref:armadillo repeat-containing protein 2 n=1 Tax=Boleophthalmus pectinirostris TaxID=150288 RepID=UPI00242EAC75|nr:armadillo repeat-containing protein 2 [Boleophthalmus pectinirostris]